MKHEPSISHQRMFSYLALMTTCLLLLPSVGNGQIGSDPASEEAHSEIIEARVFRQQASVVRHVRIEANTQPQLVRVVGLPHSLRRESVRAEPITQKAVPPEPSKSMTVQSLRVMPHLIPVDQEEQAQRAERIAMLTSEIQDASHHVAVIEQDLETIETLVQFSSAQTTENLAQSKLNVESVSAIADYVMQRRRKLAQELHQTRQLVSKKQGELDRQLRTGSRNENGKSTGSYDVLLSVLAPVGGQLRLTYWVDDVHWAPTYTIHASEGDGNRNRFVVQMDATVIQNSGEDWQGVQLAFCTGVPNLQADGPVLAPLRVSASGNTNPPPSPANLFGAPSPSQQVAPAWEDPDAWQRNVNLNTMATSRQVTEINRRQSVQRELANDANQNLADETFQVDGKRTLADDSSGQAITVLRSELTSPVYRVVTPLLSSFAYREATLQNDTGQNLAGGKATVFLNGNFVGQMTLPPTASGGQFAVGLGADRQVRTRRELLSRDESIKGGNRLSTLQYRLVVSNYHPNEIDVRLYDRLPITDGSSAINIVANESSLGKLSQDAKYLRMQRPTGILRWDLSIPAKRFGSDAYDHHFAYTVETDRTQSVVSQDVKQQVENDLRFNGAGGGGMGGGGMGGFGGGMGGGQMGGGGHM